MNLGTALACCALLQPPNTACIQQSLPRSHPAMRLFSTLLKNPKVFMDVSIGSRPAGRLVFELFSDNVPKTAENFRVLCAEQREVAGTALTYKGSTFHRIINGFMAQGGDFTNHNGTGGVSIYGNKFPDENFVDRHTGRGKLSMANAGPDTNGSQFFITFTATPHLDGAHVVFGEVVEGDDVLDSLESVGSGSGQPLEQVVVTDCGEIKE
eukprot:m.18223 g.18223  ORF g.18223 m.18223 type:complete len:210 (+) comp5669_c0_seq2:2-631(+)